MVTKEEYLKALDTVLEYHEQLNKVVVGKDEKNVLDFLRFLELHCDVRYKVRIYNAIKAGLEVQKCEYKNTSVVKIEEMPYGHIRNFGKKSKKELSRVLELFKAQ